MEGHAKKCVERYCEFANKTTQQLYKVFTPCIDDHHFKEEEMKSVGELSQVCSQIVLKFLYLARIGRPDILWSVKKLARSITKWTKACDKRLNRLISYIHHTCEWPGGWGPQGMFTTGGGGLARVPNQRVCEHLCVMGWHTQGEKDELTSCRGTVLSAWQKPPVSREGGRAGLPARVSGRHVVRGTDRPHLSWKCAQGDRQGW